MNGYTTIQEIVKRSDIPENSRKPADARIKSGKYIKGKEKD